MCIRMLVFYFDLTYDLMFLMCVGVMIRWGDIHGSVSAQVFPVGVPEEEFRQNGEPVLSIRQPDTDDVHVVLVPRRFAVVVGCRHRHA